MESCQDDLWVFDIEKLKENLNENTKFIVINSPHNPTGKKMQNRVVKNILVIVLLIAVFKLYIT